MNFEVLRNYEKYNLIKGHTVGISDHFQAEIDWLVEHGYVRELTREEFRQRMEEGMPETGDRSSS